MDSVLGIAGPGFVVIAADMSAARSILAYQYSDSKVRLALGGLSPSGTSVASQHAIELFLRFKSWMITK